MYDPWFDSAGTRNSYDGLSLQIMIRLVLVGLVLIVQMLIRYVDSAD